MIEPAWVMAGIAAGGVLFQGGIGWATLEQIKGDRRKNEARDEKLNLINSKVDQHEWRLSSHDARIHVHDEQLDKIRKGT